jgi:hypothetical protein
MDTPETNTENPIDPSNAIPLRKTQPIGLKKQNKRYAWWIVSLIVLNTLLYTMIIKGRTMPERFTTALWANLVGYNLIGFLLGTMAALFPYKKLPYQKKYLRASLLTIIVIQSLMTCGLLVILLMTLIGWY